MGCIGLSGKTDLIIFVFIRFAADGGHSSAGFAQAEFQEMRL